MRKVNLKEVKCHGLDTAYSQWGWNLTHYQSTLPPWWAKLGRSYSLYVSETCIWFSASVEHDFSCRHCSTLSCPCSLHASVPSSLPLSMEDRVTALVLILLSGLHPTSSSELSLLLMFFTSHCFFHAVGRGALVMPTIIMLLLHLHTAFSCSSSLLPLFLYFPRR